MSQAATPEEFKKKIEEILATEEVDGYLNDTTGWAYEEMRNLLRDLGYGEAIDLIPEI